MSSFKRSLRGIFSSRNNQANSSTNLVNSVVSTSSALSNTQPVALISSRISELEKEKNQEIIKKDIGSANDTTEQSNQSLHHQPALQSSSPNESTDTTTVLTNSSGLGSTSSVVSPATSADQALEQRRKSSANQHHRVNQHKRAGSATSALAETRAVTGGIAFQRPVKFRSPVEDYQFDPYDHKNHQQQKKDITNKLSRDKNSVRSLQTPLNLIMKSNPLMLLTQHSGNNKVGSSFMLGTSGSEPNQPQRTSGASLEASAFAGGGGASSGSGGNYHLNQTNIGGSPPVAGLLPIQSRKVRDSGSLLFMLVFLGLLAYVIWDGVYIKQADLNLIVHGHDSFGNICGRNNKPIKFADKSGQNYTSRPYTKYTLINSQFERYTLDESRSTKDGDTLVYIKEEEHLARLKKHNNTTTTPLDSLKSYPPTTRQMQPLLNDRRAAAATSSFQAQSETLATSAASTLELKVAAPSREVDSVVSLMQLGRSLQGENKSQQQQQQQLQPHSKVILGAKHNSNSNNSSSSRFKRQTNVSKALVSSPLDYANAATTTAASTTRHNNNNNSGTSNILDELNRAQQSRNVHLLNAIKSNLMYQYPPMYGYSSSSSSGNGDSVGGTHAQVTTMKTILPATDSHTKTNNNNNYQHRKYLTQTAQLLPLPLLMSAGQKASSTNNSALASSSSSSSTLSSSSFSYRSSVEGANSVNDYDPLEARESILQNNNNNNNTNTNNNKQFTQQQQQQQQQQFKRQTQFNVPPFYFDDHRFKPLTNNNDSDRYEHVLVTPISVLTTGNYHHHQQQPPSPQTTSLLPRPFRPSMIDAANAAAAAAAGSESTPVIISSHETSSSQLLYLTECVSSCPSDHVELIFYRCLPNNWRFSLFPNAINVTRTFIDDILTDMSHCYKELVYTFSLALVLSLGLLILLRFLASIIIWSCIMVLISLFLSMASYAWLSFYYQILELNNMMPHDPSYARKLAQSDRWLIGSIFLTFVAFATIGAIIFMRKRIVLVTMLFRESGKAIADMPLLLLQPLFTFAALVGIMTAWSIGLICLQSMKRPMLDFSTGFVVFKAETLYKIMKWYHVFAFLWVSHFAIACQHYVIGASVTKWYFSPNRYQLSSPIGNSISELILYYLGSVALGSFLVAIFKVIRIITRQIQFLIQRSCIATQSASAGHSPTGGAGNGTGLTNSLAIPPQASSSSCCGSLGYIWRLSLWFIDNIVMIINRDAYVEIAIHGDSFLSGARRAFAVLASNPLRLLAIKSVGNLLLIITKICVVFGTVSVAYVLIEEKQTTLNYAWSPVVVSALYAYIVAHWFLSVYEMVIDALFICYCEDYEMTKSQAELARQIRGNNFMAHILAAGGGSANSAGLF